MHFRGQLAGAEIRDKTPGRSLRFSSGRGPAGRQEPCPARGYPPPHLCGPSPGGELVRLFAQEDGRLESVAEVRRPAG